MPEHIWGDVKEAFLHKVYWEWHKQTRLHVVMDYWTNHHPVPAWAKYKSHISPSFKAGLNFTLLLLGLCSKHRWSSSHDDGWQQLTDASRSAGETIVRVSHSALMCFITSQAPITSATGVHTVRLVLFALVSRTGRSDEVMDWKLSQSEEKRRVSQKSLLSQHVVPKTSKFCCAHETQSCKICGGCHSKHLSPAAHLPSPRWEGSSAKRASSLTYQDIKYPLSGAWWRQYQYKLMQLTRDSWNNALLHLLNESFISESLFQAVVGQVWAALVQLWGSRVTQHPPWNAWRTRTTYAALSLQLTATRGSASLTIWDNSNWTNTSLMNMSVLKSLFNR